MVHAVVAVSFDMFLCACDAVHAQYEEGSCQSLTK